MSQKPYILGSVVARGGMAEIYRGLHVGQDGFKRMVAVKRILPHQAQNAEFTEMFKDEAHIGQRLQHANIVKVEGFDIIEGSPSIVMEFVDGSDLRALLAATETRKVGPGKRSFMPVELCLYIIAEAARGLHYAHTRRDDISGKPLNIVHRDISPQNILISWEGEVKVTDFGIAAADRDFKQTETKAGIVKGKYSYMSPEQISGKKCDARTDVFALSIVLWEMLTMHRMFTSDNEFEVIEMVRNCKIPVRMRDVNPGISDDLEALVMRGLAKDPRRRYETMEVFERTLRGFLASRNVSISANEVSHFIKDVLSERREVSRDEMRKILTSTKLPSAASNNTSNRSSLELAFDPSSGDSSSLTIGRVTKPPTSSLPSQLQPSNQPSLGRPPSAHRNVPYRPSDPRMHRNRQNSKNQNSSIKSVVLFTAACVIALAGFVLFKNHQNAAKQALTLVVKSQPETVRIKINEREHANGKYVTTPAKIRLEPGLNSVEFIRPGYSAEKIFVNTDDGAPKNQPPIRLKSNAPFAPVRIEYRGNASLTITLNGGFFKQKVTPQKNVVQVADLTSGLPVELAAITSEKKTLMKCTFTPISTTEKRPMVIILDATKQSCDVGSASSKREDSR